MAHFLELLEQRLYNRRILIVEDDASTAVSAETALAEMGCRVYLAQDLHRALKVAATKSIDCALLDIGIGESQVFSVADVLSVKKIPFVFSSGYDKDVMPERYRDHAVVAKPYLFKDIVRELVGALHLVGEPRDRESHHIADKKSP